MAEVAQVIAAQSVAASGTANPTIALPNLTKEVVIVVAAQYAAAAATTGISVALQVSYNNGSTYSASAQPTVVVPGVAGVLEQNQIVYRMFDDPFHLDQGVPTNLKVGLTNLDATNAAVVSVAVQAMTHAA